MCARHGDRRRSIHVQKGGWCIIKRREISYIIWVRGFLRLGSVEVYRVFNSAPPEPSPSRGYLE
jgi:hypothetical protein